ncbi:MAG: hypothetical protein Q7J85_11045 [Bacillota bacterium]|nr:hypothetical protein [Bacillota bacterium]
MLADIGETCFERLNIDDCDDWKKEQWEQSSVLFDAFFKYLKEEKGLKEEIAGQKTNMAVFFVMDFLFVYYDAAEDIRNVDDYAIKTFLGNWYIRKFMSPKVTEMNKFLRAIADFYTFLQKRGFIGKDCLREIKETCKDKEWFAQRLKSYFDTTEDEFEDWIDEYDYRMM